MSDLLTIERIQKAHPKIRLQLLQQYREINSRLPADVRLRFSHVFRTPAEQHKLFIQRPKVTKADSWQSVHNYGLAMDIVLLYDKDKNGSFELASWENNKYWMQVTNYFKSKGWECGGDWKGFKDAPHFQMDFGYKWQQLKVMIDTGKIIEDANGIIYAKI